MKMLDGVVQSPPLPPLRSGLMINVLPDSYPNLLHRHEHNYLPSVSLWLVHPAASLVQYIDVNSSVMQSAKTAEEFKGAAFVSTTVGLLLPTHRIGDTRSVPRAAREYVGHCAMHRVVRACVRA